MSLSENDKPRYDRRGFKVDSGYTRSGEEIIDQSIPLTVMSYNIQKWTKMNGWKSLQDGIFGDYNPDVVGLQEYTANASIEGQSIESYLESYFQGE